MVRGDGVGGAQAAHGLVGIKDRLAALEDCTWTPPSGGGTAPPSRAVDRAGHVAGVAQPPGRVEGGR
jgi:hypothetical protein